MTKAQIVAFWLALLSTLAAGRPAAADNPQCEPGTVAAAAYALIVRGNARTGCDRFLAAVHAGSRDAWVYRGAALCAAQTNAAKRLAKPLGAVLHSRAVRPELAALGRGFLAWFGKDYDKAESELRQVRKRAPHLALASNALGAVIKSRGDAVAAIPFIKDALQRCPGLAMAYTNLRDAELRSQVFERLLQRLETLPKRWSQLPKPAFQPSGKQVEDVLASASAAEKQAALVLISRLAQTAARARHEVLDAERKARALSEVDVWVPFLLSDKKKLRDPTEAALTIDAGFDLAEVLGRRDALLSAASQTMELVGWRLPPQRVLHAAEQWVVLPVAAPERRGAAMVATSHANLLFRAGYNRRAIKGYRQARNHFLAVGDKLGQGNSWDGEADVLFRLGDNLGALDAYRHARTHYLTVGSQLGQGNTFLGQADVLFRLGDNLGALNTYRHARTHYLAVGDRLGQGNTFLGQADVLFRLGINRGALAAYRRARTYFFTVGSQLGQGHTFQGQADVLFRLGDNLGALDAYRRARSHYLTVGSQLGQGNTFQGEADVLFRLGGNLGALDAYRRARIHFFNVGDKLGQSNSFRGEADVLFRLGDNQGALDAYRHARTHFLTVDAQLGQGNSFQGEANVLFRFGDNQGALHTYRHARSHFLTIGDKLGQGNSWVGEADVWFRLGDNQGALDAYRHARTHFLDIGDKLGQGNSFRGEADVRFRVGDYQGALDAYRQARTHFLDVGDRLGQGNTFLGQADVRFRLRDNQGALDAYRQARTHFLDVGDRLGQGNTFLGEAYVLFRVGDYQGALDAYRQARTHFLDVGDKLGQSYSWVGEARLMVRLQRARAAEFAAQKAVRLAAKGSLPSKIDARMVLARALAAQGRNPMANAEATRALKLLALWRAQGYSDLDRTAMANRSEPYDFLVPRLAKTANHRMQALLLAEDAHAPVLLDLLATSARPARGSNDQTLRRQSQRIHSELARVHEQLSRTLDISAKTRLKQQQRDLDSRLEYNDLATPTNKIGTGERLSTQAQRDLIAAVGPTVLYYVAPDETIAFLLRPDREGLRVAQIAASRNGLKREIQALRHDLANPLWQKRARHRAQTLFKQLLGPFASQLAETSPLTIIPHGPLHQLPFEALVDAHGKRVFERWDVTMAPSLAVLAHVRQRATARRRTSKSNRFIAFAAGQGLHFPDHEVKDIARIFGRDQATFHQGKATFASYKQEAPNAHHLLISTRGVHVPNSRTGTYLEVTPTRDRDHRLTAGEIAQIPLRAELVTLAACVTAQAEAMLNDERLDLSRAFLIAGASTVLATRWNVPESHATRQFLNDFYRALHTGGTDGNGLRKDQALSRARRLAMQRGDDAQLWAAWVLIGDRR